MNDEDFKLWTKLCNTIEKVVVQLEKHNNNIHELQWDISVIKDKLKR